MGKSMLIIMAAAAALSLPTMALCAFDFHPPIVIDHHSTDLTPIPGAWIDSVQKHVRLHYGHTSHGAQLTRGLELIEAVDPRYDAAIQYQSLPSVPGALCVFDGQETLTYVTPEDYWNTASGMNNTRNVLRHNPSINMSMFCWCTQLGGATPEYVQAYLDSMSALEAEFPGVTFVYMTGNAQAVGWEGNNRHQRNEQIRQFCKDNDKVLYDFADLDCWWFNPGTQQWEFSTYLYNGTPVPFQHPHWNGSEWGHTTLESCEQKGKALWWLFMSIGGWRDILAGVDQTPLARSLLDVQQNFPNPFDGATSISFTVNGPGRVRLDIFSVTGQLVKTVWNGYFDAGAHTIGWSGTDRRGRAVPNGVYFYRMTGPYGVSVTKKMMRLR
jgi:hypothetical protein